MSRARLAEQRGMTLVELTVTMALLGVVSLLFTLVLASVQQGIDRQADRSNDNDQARLAVQQLDRDIRSGNLLYDPAAEIDPFYSMRVYTQSFANVLDPGNRCVQWRLVRFDDGPDQLQRRTWGIQWPTDPDGLVSGWRIVATDVVNADLDDPATAAPDEPLFQLDSDPAKGSRIVVVNIVTQTDPDSGSPIRIEASITGRNTSYGYPADVCANIPPV